MTPDTGESTSPSPVVTMETSNASTQVNDDDISPASSHSINTVSENSDQLP